MFWFGRENVYIYYGCMRKFIVYSHSYATSWNWRLGVEHSRWYWAPWNCEANWNVSAHMSLPEVSRRFMKSSRTSTCLTCLYSWRLPAAYKLYSIYGGTKIICTVPPSVSTARTIKQEYYKAQLDSFPSEQGHTRISIHGSANLPSHVSCKVQVSARSAWSVGTSCEH